MKFNILLYIYIIILISNLLILLLLIIYFANFLIYIKKINHTTI